ncbi:MAG: hypothetical protein M0R33_14020 [Methylomonas sp.]|jgi:hypothetical protein|uniref:hypothetical protein n=1 Tax=Methylomonas sp. TaxID=418 RepID=UPI0025F1D4D6|nr:hypothetical protein [Methylomonas sp.]MCK9607553.1 hypothetical protein [Methylomonas sp.]
MAVSGNNFAYLLIQETENSKKILQFVQENREQFIRAAFQIRILREFDDALLTRFNITRLPALILSNGSVVVGFAAISEALRGATGLHSPYAINMQSYQDRCMYAKDDDDLSEDADEKRTEMYQKKIRQLNSRRGCVMPPDGAPAADVARQSLDASGGAANAPRAQGEIANARQSLDAVPRNVRKPTHVEEIPAAPAAPAARAAPTAPPRGGRGAPRGAPKSFEDGERLWLENTVHGGDSTFTI